MIERGGLEALNKSVLDVTSGRKVDHVISFGASCMYKHVKLVGKLRKLWKHCTYFRTPFQKVADYDSDGKS